jgi:hypothetical protein
MLKMVMSKCEAERSVCAFYLGAGKEKPAFHFF